MLPSLDVRTAHGLGITGWTGEDPHDEAGIRLWDDPNPPVYGQVFAAFTSRSRRRGASRPPDVAGAG